MLAHCANAVHEEISLENLLLFHSVHSWCRGGRGSSSRGRLPATTTEVVGHLSVKFVGSLLLGTASIATTLTAAGFASSRSVAFLLGLNLLRLVLPGSCLLLLRLVRDSVAERLGSRDRRQVCSVVYYLDLSDCQ